MLLVNVSDGDARQSHKRAAEDTDATASSSTRNSKATKSQGDATAGQDAIGGPGFVNRTDDSDKENEKSQPDPHEYVTICQPERYLRDQYRNDLETGQLTEQDIEDILQRCGKEGCMCSKPAAEHPDYPYVMMRGALRKLLEDRAEVAFRDPDGFGLEAYTDSAGWGIQEMIENMVVEINKTKILTKDRWIVFVRLVHLILDGDVMGWQMSEDGPRAIATYNVIGWGFLAMLAELERAGELKRDSEYRDLGLIMIEYLKLGEEWGDYGFDEDGWVDPIVSYALKYNIDLAFTDSSKEDWESKRKQRGNPSELPEPTSNKNDPWEWKKKYKALESEYGAPRTLLSRKNYLGGNYYNITKWSRQDRGELATDGKDPLPDDIIRGLRKGDRIIGVV